MSNKNIDFNTDLAQGFGVYKNELEYEILDYMSSVNISCGFHAGDPVTIKTALEKCKEKNVVVGAHIGFCDLAGFGYRPMELNETELEATILYQLAAITSFAKTYNIHIEHVRPHGAMYKMAAENYEFSLSIAKIIQKFDKWLVYYGLANENLEKVHKETGIVVAREVFIDKSYNSDGLVEWDKKDPVSQDVSLNRIRTILHSSQMKVAGGNFVTVNCDTIHFAAKSKESVELAKKAYEIIHPAPVNFNKAEVSGWL